MKPDDGGPPTSGHDSTSSGQPNEAPRPAAGLPVAQATKPWRERLLDVVVAFTPKWVSELRGKGLLRAFVLGVSLAVIVPPLMMISGAYLIGELQRFDSPIATAVRNSMLNVIHDGLSFEEVASRSHARLDYMQWFELRLVPRKRPIRELRISLKSL